MSKATNIFKTKDNHIGIFINGNVSAHAVPSAAERKTRHALGFCLSVKNAAYKSKVFIVMLSINTYSI